MLKTRRKDTVFSSGLMDGYTKVYGRTGSSTARERSSPRMEIRLRPNGTRDNKSSKIITTDRGASSEKQDFYNFCEIILQYTSIGILHYNLTKHVQSLNCMFKIDTK
jgi:hypothetical protein